MIEVALAIPVFDDRVLVARRSPQAHLGECWEFPGGKLAAGEEPAAGARRELEEETGLVAGVLEPLLVLVHEYPERSIRFHVFLARDVRGPLRIAPVRAWDWKRPAELRELPMPEANRTMIGALCARVGSSPA